MPTDEELKIAMLALQVLCRGSGALTRDSIRYEIRNRRNVYVNRRDLRPILDDLSRDGFLTRIQTTDRNGKPEIKYQITVMGYERYDALQRHRGRRSK